MYLSPKQAAERLGVCRKTIWRHIKAGNLKAYHISAKTIRIDPKDLEEFVERENKEAVK